MSENCQHPPLKNRIQRADAIRPLLRQLIETTSVRDAERATGISRTVLHDFVYGGKTPQEKNLSALERWAEKHREAHGWSDEAQPEGEGAGLSADVPPEADELFAYFEGIIRHMGGPDTDPEEMRLRRLDALEGLRRFFSARGPVPAWWYKIKERVERGEV